MNVYVCTNHDGHYPVGVASVVFAQDEDAARALLDAELLSAGLKAHSEEPYTLERIFHPELPRALILNNGDY